MGLWERLFGRRGSDSSAAEPVRGGATPAEAVRRHFEAIATHDLDAILLTLCTQRARLYSDPRTLDKRRQTVDRVEILAIEPAEGPVPLPSYAGAYQQRQILKVEYDLHLVPPDRRRDPTLREGRQWVYYILVSEGPGQPWLIADWGV